MGSCCIRLRSSPEKLISDNLYNSIWLLKTPAAIALKVDVCSQPKQGSLEDEASTHGKVDCRFQAGIEPPKVFL